MQTYLFYDIETTGLNPCFNQVIQFAGVRTDDSLRILSQDEIRVQLRPDVIPEPEAIITHQIGIDSMLSGSLEVEATQKIHALLNRPETISLGYNTLGFDDEFLRFSFYRNLLAPYTHQYANHCGRMDLYPIIIFYYLFSPEVLSWPVQADGKLSLKLEALMQKNFSIEGRAHDAMVDVEATISLAKALQKKSSIWDFVSAYFDKNQDKERMIKWDLLSGQNIGLYVDGSLGVLNQFMAPVLCLGRHRHYKNQWLFLRLDQENFKESLVKEGVNSAWVYRKKMGEPGFLLPPEKRYLDKISQDRLALLESNKAWIKQNIKLFNELVNYHLDYQYPIVPRADVDSILYQRGFSSPADEDRCRAFHRAPVLEKIKLVSDFSDFDLQELASRLLGRNYFSSLPSEEKEKFKQFLSSALVSESEESMIDFRGNKKVSLIEAKQRSVLLRERKELSSDQQALLVRYEEWLERLNSSW